MWIKKILPVSLFQYNKYVESGRQAGSIHTTVDSTEAENAQDKEATQEAAAEAAAAEECTVEEPVQDKDSTQEAGAGTAAAEECTEAESEEATQGAAADAAAAEEFVLRGWTRSWERDREGSLGGLKGSSGLSRQLLGTLCLSMRSYGETASRRLGTTC